MAAVPLGFDFGDGSSTIANTSDSSASNQIQQSPRCEEYVVPPVGLTSSAFQVTSNLDPSTLPDGWVGDVQYFDPIDGSRSWYITLPLFPFAYLIASAVVTLIYIAMDGNRFGQENLLGSIDYLSQSSHTIFVCTAATLAVSKAIACRRSRMPIKTEIRVTRWQKERESKLINREER
jgi:hypothetical protein